MTDGRTHWDYCFRDHQDCAERMVEELTELRRIADALILWIDRPTSGLDLAQLYERARVIRK